MWDAAKACLWWVDIENGHVLRFDPATGDEGRFEFDGTIGFVAPMTDENVVFGSNSGLYRLHWPSKAIERFAHPEAHLPSNRFNDAAIDPHGRLWTGTLGKGASEPRGSFYRSAGPDTITRWKSGFYTTNGLAFSPSGDRMYFSDSYQTVRKIWVCDYDLATGTPSETRLFLDTKNLAGRPDGGAMDSEGHYWMAGVGGWQIYRISPAGEVVLTVDVPVEKPTKIAFGGPDLDLIYLTSIGGDLTPGTENRQPDAGRILEISGLGIRGVPQARYGWDTPVKETCS